MKHIAINARRAAAGLIPAAALLAIPAFAQEVPAPVAPPPVTQTVPAPTPTPATPTAPESATPAQNPTTSRTTLSPEAQAALDAARERPAPRPARAAPAQRATPQRAAPVVAAPVAAAPAPDVIPAPVETVPVQTVPEAVAPVVDAPAATAETTTETGDTPMWPLFALLALGIAAIVAFVMFRRRRATEQAYYDEPYVEEAYVEPAPEPVIERTPVAAAAAVPAAAAIAAGQNWQMTAPTIKARKPFAASPVAAAPIAAVPVVAAALEDEAPVATADDATVSAADGEDLAALTGAKPVADRPWLEFAMRPVRAGTSADEAVVEIELTVANAGSIRADDVRIATFMLPAGADSEMERLLTGGAADPSIAPTSIDPGEGTRIDATLALLKSDIGTGARGEDFSPVVVADARYRLPDGSEGRTSAAFRIGARDEGGRLTPFALDDREMFDDVEADLEGLPHRA